MLNLYLKGGDDMIVGQNIKYLRKDILGLSREKFAEKLGISAGEINNIERGVLARPELKEPLFRLICSEFNINYNWLMTSKEPIYLETQEDAIERFAQENGLTYHAKKVLAFYLSLDEEKQKAVDELFQDFINSYSNEEAATSESIEEETIVETETGMEIDTELQAELDAIAEFAQQEELKETKSSYSTSYNIANESHEEIPKDDDDDIQTFKIASRNGQNELRLSREQRKALIEAVENHKETDLSDLI